jgi:hypothetical protein
MNIFTFYSRNIFLLTVFLTLIGSNVVFAQTPGAIYQPATPATNPLNPNGDGFATSSGTALNTSSPEASQFELP